MTRKKPSEGDVYGRLKVVQRDVTRRNKTNRFYWFCQCSCGNLVSVRNDLLGIKTNSCGCLKLEQNKKNLGRYTTGESHSRLASIWYHMKGRCEKPSDTNYRHYGARGITVCEEWKSDFLSFKKWSIENGYNDKLTIDRIDVNGNYEPSNCRWLNLQDQLNNKRNTLWVLHNGERKSLMQAYKEENPDITYQTAKTRYHQGYTDTSELFKNRRKK